MMKNIKSFQNYSQKNEAWNSFLRGPKTDDARRDALRSQKYAHTGTNPTNYIEFEGRKFYNQDFLFAKYHDTGKIPNPTHN